MNAVRRFLDQQRTFADDEPPDQYGYVKALVDRESCIVSYRAMVADGDDTTFLIEATILNDEHVPVERGYISLPIKNWEGIIRGLLDDALSQRQAGMT